MVCTLVVKKCTRALMSLHSQSI